MNIITLQNHFAALKVDIEKLNSELEKTKNAVEDTNQRSAVALQFATTPFRFAIFRAEFLCIETVPMSCRNN